MAQVATKTKTDIRPMHCNHHGVVDHRIFSDKSGFAMTHIILVYKQCTLCYKRENPDLRCCEKEPLSYLDFNALMYEDYW